MINSRTACVTTTRPSVYYDALMPENRAGRPWLVMVHGGAHMGTCYLQTADGRPGWAPYFAERGYPVAVPDWPGSGRSGQVPLDELDGETVCRGLGGVIDALDGPVVLMTHSMSGAYGWKLLETHGAKIAALVAAAPAPPENIQAVSEVIERGEGFVEVQALALRWRLSLDQPFSVDRALIDTKLVGESTRFPRETLDGYLASLRPIAPRLIYERQNVDGSQIRVGDIGSLRDKTVLIITGEHDIDHSREVDGTIATWLDDAGADVEFQFLPDHGIPGNGHMMMLEDNSDEIAARIADWVDGVL